MSYNYLNKFKRWILPKTTFLNLNEKKRKKILNTLIKYFANNPYEKVDIEDVAKECKVY